jgi:TPR repeat protein
MGLSVPSIYRSHFHSLARKIRINNRKLPADAPVAVVLQAEYDHNGAFDASFKNYDIVTLSKTHRVVFRIINQACQVHEIIQETYESTKKNIQCLILRGHGTATEITLGKKTCFHASDFTEEDRRALDPGATIILDSCDTGLALADQIHKAAHIVLFAPKAPISWQDTCFRICPKHGPELCSKKEVYQSGHASCSYRTVDLAARFAYTKQRAESGHIQAQYELAQCYEDGIGVKPHEGLAIAWYTRAALQGNREAQYRLGVFYTCGWGVKQSDEEAAKWYTLAAEQGNPDAQFQLAKCYFDGRGVKRSIWDATVWLAQASDRNQEASQYLCFLLRNNASVQKAMGDFYSLDPKIQSDEEAAKWYTRAAERGNPDAQYQLSLCYRDGIGVTPDEKYAMYWLTQAARQGQLKAKEILKQQKAATTIQRVFRGHRVRKEIAAQKAAI